MNLKNELYEHYEHIFSTELISTAVEMLQIGGIDANSNSLTLRGELHQGKSKLISLKNVGKEIWSAEDAQDYVSGLRREW